VKTPERGPILIVEDDAADRLSLGDLLRDEGFEVVEASNGRVALDYVLAASLPPSVILADLHMPVMPGAELIEVLGSYFRLRRIPVVVLTGDPEPPTYPPQTVVARFLKPPPPEQLLALVGKYAACKPPGSPGSAVDPAELPVEAD
jgi:CheY-like chemotaxis protein